MAITGEGTKASPYLVHDYDELKKVCPRDYSGIYNGNELGIKYVRLESNIDCNTYGSSFEWEGFDLGGGSSDGTVCDFNLNNHTIKNVMIAPESHLFCPRSYNGKGTKIHDGKILNVFCNKSSNIIKGDHGIQTIIECSIENVSMSVNGTSMTGNGFQNTVFKNSSLYFVSARLNSDLIYIYTNNDGHKNTDFYFNIDSGETEMYPFYNKQDSDIHLDGCRIRGKINCSYKFYGLNNCVVDADLYVLEGQKLFENSTGIFNLDRVTSASSYPSSNMIGCTTEEMKDASALASKGFTVVDIGG